jgi:hypothetical protein
MVSDPGFPGSSYRLWRDTCVLAAALTLHDDYRVLPRVLGAFRLRPVYSAC